MRVAHNLISLDGRYFGELTVLRREGRAGRQATWRCLCACGNECVVSGYKLRSGHTKSCGRNHYYRHPMNVLAAAERKIWEGMIQRCHNPNSLPGYRFYGAKGIKVCNRWRKDFAQFLSDIGPRPSPLHSIDRYPDRDGNYEPGNCRWATAKQQSDNQNGRLRVEIDGKIVLLRDYTRAHGISDRMVRKRLLRGWSLEEALLEPSLRPWQRSLST